jgi:hypothetical protein
LGGGRMAQKSPDYEDQKFEITYVNIWVWWVFCMSPKIPPYTLCLEIDSGSMRK